MQSGQIGESCHWFQITIRKEETSMQQPAIKIGDQETPPLPTSYQPTQNKVSRTSPISSPLGRYSNTRSIGKGSFGVVISADDA